MIMINILLTDRQTDGQNDMRSQDSALH